MWLDFHTGDNVQNHHKLSTEPRWLLLFAANIGHPEEFENWRQTSTSTSDFAVFLMGGFLKWGYLPQSSKSWMTILVLNLNLWHRLEQRKLILAKKHLKTKNKNRIKNIFTKQDAAHEPECNHVGHFFETSYLNSLVHMSPVTVPVHCRLWNMEWSGVQEVGIVECGL